LQKYARTSRHVYNEYVGIFRENIDPKDLLVTNISDRKTKKRLVYVLNKQYVDLREEGKVSRRQYQKNELPYNTQQTQYKGMTRITTPKSEMERPATWT